ncbi:MAG: hypothetical protein WBE34_09720 [Candidatus Nitrosopolaris sp.]
MHFVTQKCEDIATRPRETNKSKPSATANTAYLSSDSIENAVDGLTSTSERIG